MPHATSKTANFDATATDSVKLSPTDRSLVVMVRDGDQDAAATLYDRYARRVLGLVRSKLGTHLSATTEPEDIVQSVFRSIFRGMQAGNYEAPQGKTLWNLLAVISVNKLADKANHHKAKCRDSSRNVPLDSSPDDMAVVIDQASVEFFEVCMQETLELLHPLQRKILTLRLEGHGVEEISEQLGRSKRTVERGLQKCREVLADSLLNDD